MTLASWAPRVFARGLHSLQLRTFSMSQFGASRHRQYWKLVRHDEQGVGHSNSAFK